MAEGNGEQSEGGKGSTGTTLNASEIFPVMFRKATFVTSEHFNEWIRTGILLEVPTKRLKEFMRKADEKKYLYEFITEIVEEWIGLAVAPSIAELANALRSNGMGALGDELESELAPGQSLVSSPQQQTRQTANADSSLAGSGFQDKPFSGGHPIIKGKLMIIATPKKEDSSSGNSENDGCRSNASVKTIVCNESNELSKGKEARTDGHALTDRHGGSGSRTQSVVPPPVKKLKLDACGDGKQQTTKSKGNDFKKLKQNDKRNSDKNKRKESGKKREDKNAKDKRDRDRKYRSNRRVDHHSKSKSLGRNRNDDKKPKSVVAKRKELCLSLIDSSCSSDLSTRCSRTTSSSSIEMRSYLNEIDTNGYNRFHRAVKRNRVDTVQELLVTGVDVNEPSLDAFKNTPLHLAARYIQNRDDAIEMIKLLVKNGANVSKINLRMCTFMDELLRDISSSEDGGEVRRINAAHFHDLVKFLIESGRKEFLLLSERKQDGCVLHWSIKELEISEQTINLLHYSEVNLNHLSQTDGNSILYYAIWGGRSIGKLKKLIDLGVDWKHVNKKKWNLLHVAARYCHLEAFEYLVDRDPELGYSKNEAGNTPLDIFKKYHYENASAVKSVTELLKKYYKNNNN